MKRQTIKLRPHGRYLFFFVTVLGMMMVAGPLYGGKLIDRVVAVVNDEIISLYDLDQRVRPYAEEIKKTNASPAEQDELRQKVREEHLDLLIDEKLADQEIKRLGIRVDDTEVEREIERFKAVNQLTDEALQQALAAQGSALDEFRREIRGQILRARLVNREIRSKVVVTQEEVAAYYEAHPEEFGGEKKYHLKNIVMVIPAASSRKEKSEVFERLNHVYTKLSEGEPFETLARQYSEAPNAGDGGWLGIISKSALASPIQKALASLKTGNFTAIIETEQGYQIFFLEDIETGSPDPLEEVRLKIEDKLYNEVITRQYETWLKDLRQRSHIKLVR